MENLKLYLEVSQSLQLQSNDEFLTFSAIDVDRHRLFFASSANFVYTSQLSSFQNESAWRRTSLASETSHIELEDGDFIVSFDYIMEKESLLLGTHNGQMLLHNVDDKFTEVVGQLEGGVRCISPSPDGDLLCIITGFHQMLVMTHDWDLLYETSLRSSSDGVDVQGPGIDLELEIGSSVSWRGDAKYFATLSNDSVSQKRLKVWERDSGALQASSDPNLFAGTVLEWMPSGAKIAAVRDRKSENLCPSIVFFERNGLERSSFSINEAIDSRIKLLRWNSSSELLASIVRCNDHDIVKIWYFSNNHWYLKYEIQYLREDEVNLVWDPVKPYDLMSWTLRGQVSLHSFIWKSAVSENSTALVIDGCKILVTPLSLALMPPPMCFFTLKFPSPVQDLDLYSKNSKNHLAAFLSNGCLCVAELPSDDNLEVLQGTEINVEPSRSEISLGSFIHLTWLDSNKILAVSHYGFSHSNSLDTSLSGYCLQEVELVCSESCVPSSVRSSGWHSNLSSQTAVEDLVISVASNHDSTKPSAFIQFHGGKISDYVSNLGVSRDSLKRDEWSFTSSCPRAIVAASKSNGPLIFGLDYSGRLHFSGRILCNNCSSFSFYSSLANRVITHLILATKQDYLYIVDIDDILTGDVENKYTNFVHVNKRKEDDNINFVNIWERGAKIAGVVHGDEAGVILQTTRGNLESVYPRKLVLLSICNALAQKRFRDALLMLRRHRIDFNVIVDQSGWEVFIQSASEFVRQVKSLNHITEFVCALKKENVMVTLYKKFESLHLSSKPQLSGPEATNKVSEILRAIKKALEEQLPESPSRELCILTTLARSDPPELEEALERVKVIREMELLGSEDPKRILYPSAEEALKHLLWLSDPEAVYESALGLYDLNLVAIVALNSQRDPKEFLPYLQELESLPDEVMRYKIDLELCRFEKALRHIVSAGDDHYSDCMDLMKQNPQLFPMGLQLITDHAKKLQILEAWGDHLNKEKLFDDAAKTYLCCSCFEKASKSYRDCGDWVGVLTVAGLVKLGKEEVKQLAQELCEELQALGKPGEAAKIAIEYCGDIMNGLSLLIAAREWDEALRIALMHNNEREDLVSEVKSSSLDCASALIAEYEESLEKVGKYLARYLAVRQRRLILAAKILAEEQPMSDLEDDASSQASSNFSGMSAYTTGSRNSRATSISSSAVSKARDMRRQRKKGKIRPGSAGEEMALVEHLKGMALRDGTKRELKLLIVVLVMLGEFEIARKLQRSGENFQLAQIAAVGLAEDTVSNDIIDHQTHSLEHYTQKLRAQVQNSEAFSWRCKVFPPP